MRTNWMKSMVLLIFVFAASAAYAAAISGITQTATDLTWPLLFNGIAPGAILAFVGKRYIDKQDKTNRELIMSKNDHTTRLGEIEMIHQVRGCDQPDSMVRGRRKGDPA